MTPKILWEYTRIALVVAFGLWVLAMVTGCATPTEEQKYERAARLAEYQDDYHATKKWCDKSASYVMYMDYHCRSSVGYCPPKHRTDRFACIPQRALLDAIEGRY